MDEPRPVQRTLVRRDRIQAWLRVSTPAADRPSTIFWIDPAEELIAMLLTQLVPTSTGLVRREMRVLTYQAFTE